MKNNLTSFLTIFFGISLTLLLPGFTIPLPEYAYAQYDAQYCEGKKNEMSSRASDWMTKWSTASEDPNQIIRKEGKQITSEIGLTMINCDTNLNDSDKLLLLQMRGVIDTSIDENIDYGPPCDPLCEPGPPIT